MLQIFLSLLLINISNIQCSIKKTPETSNININYQKEKLDHEKIQQKIYNEARNGVVTINVKCFKSVYTSSQKSKWKGTGFVVDKEQGIIATNRHVAGEMAVCSYDVKFSNGRIVTAKLLYYDPIYDFAFLKLDKEKIKDKIHEVTFSSKPISINDEIFMIGNSAGEEFSVYKGTIYNLYKNVGPYAEESFGFSGITVPGASGSPVFNKNAEVVGILYGGGYFSGIALPIKYITDALKYIRANKTPPRKSIGFLPQYKDIDILEESGLISMAQANILRTTFPNANNRALLINTILSGSEAENKIKPGDVLWKMNDHLIGPSLYKIEEIANNNSNKAIKITVLRNAKEVIIYLKPYNLQTNKQDKFITFAGAVFYEMNERTKFASGTSENGVFLSSCSCTSPFKDMLVAYEDMLVEYENRIKITKIGGMKIKNLSDLEIAIKKLINKNIFTIHSIDYMGGHKFGWIRVEDRKERMGFIKRNNKYSDTPKIFVLNHDSMEWDTIDISDEEKI